MISITAEEFEHNLDDYINQELKEEVEVTKDGKVLFYLTPKGVVLRRRVESMFGSLPRDAYYDDDIDRE